MGPTSRPSGSGSLPKRVMWMQEEDTGKWMLVGLSENGEVMDPRDYEEVQIPRGNRPNGKVWSRCEKTGKWTNLAAEASREDLRQAQAAIRQRASAPTERRTRGSISALHQNYASRISHGSGERGSPYHQDGSVISEEECYREGARAQPPMPDVEIVDGIKYHNVRPSDTFNFICLKYKVSADALRAANNFTGSTLQYAPKRLVIPAPAPKKTKKLESHSSSSSPTYVNEGSVYGGSRAAPHQPYQQQEEEEEEEVQYHWVEPDDSLRWICLKYKVNANDLRRANNFTGSNLKLAPKKLIIPKKPQGSVASSKKRQPRARKLKSNGSEYYCSIRSDDASLAGMSYLTMETGLQGDDHSVASSVACGSIASFRGNGHPVIASEVPENLNLGGVGDGGENLNSSFTNLGSQGSEIAPVNMVHVAGARKLYDQMSCDSDSMDSDSDGGEESVATGNKASVGGKEAMGGKSSRTRYHDVRPTDTVEYLCLKYRVSASALRRANIGLTGRNLQTGPKRLIIPPSTHSSGASVASNSVGTSSYRNKETQDTLETETVTTSSKSVRSSGVMTHDDDTNTIALSEGHSTLADQLQSLDVEEDDEDALYHDIQQGDTLQGICLRYGISAYELRRANNFRGMNLRSAPDRLVIPRNEMDQPRKDFKSMTEDEKVQALLENLPVSRMSKKPLLSRDEARAYLEFNEWSFERALKNARVDAEWSSRRR